MELTDPEYYEGKLSEDSQSHREQVQATLLSLYEEQRNSESPIARLKLQKKIDRIETQLAFQGANPKKVPFAELRDHIREPVYDPIENKYRERIRNRATGIRAYCVSCQGGDVVGVRECPAITCPLHPFRMGGDPFRGWELPKVEDIPIEDEDDAIEFEEGDDDAD